MRSFFSLMAGTLVRICCMKTLTRKIMRIRVKSSMLTKADPEGQIQLPLESLSKVGRKGKSRKLES